ncbi:MAG: hypothetical protein ACRDNK_05165 [Solirubrobacteraceae bacterium]
MQSLPMIPASCALDEGELQRQLGRYRVAGRGAQVTERTARRLVLDLAADVPDSEVQELVAVERGCCPFFGLDWDPEARRLAIGVLASDDEPALAAVAAALGLA